MFPFKSSNVIMILQLNYLKGKKMKKTFVRMAVAILIFVCGINLLYIGMMIFDKKATEKKEAETEIQHLCNQQAKEFNKVFSNVEFIVNSISAIISKSMTTEHYLENRIHFEDEKRVIDYILKEIVANAQFPLGIYFTFNPENSKGWDEIWYIRDKGGKVTFIDSPSMSSTWLEKEVEANRYYFRAIREGSFWSDVTYDVYLKEEIVSFVKPVYDANSELIGVMGVDILSKNITEDLFDIDKNIDGYTAMMNKSDKKVLGSATGKMLRSSEYVQAEANINEDFQLVILMPSDAIDAKVDEKAILLKVIAILVCLLIICIIMILFKQKISPIIDKYEKNEMFLIDRSRQIQLGEMIGSIVHQWKQPLNTMNMTVGNLKEDYYSGTLEEDQFAHYIKRIESMVKNLSETADDFRDFLHPQRKKEEFDVKEEIKKIFKMTGDRMHYTNITTTISGEGFILEGFRNEFDQCILNLLDNARDALLCEGVKKREIYIETLLKNEADKDSAKGVIIIGNTGAHIEEKVGQSIFDLYVTSKEERDGTGVGLYITRKIIEEHFHGKIFYRNVEKGVEFVIEIQI